MDRASSPCSCALQSGDVKLLKSHDHLTLVVNPVSWPLPVDLTLQEVCSTHLGKEMNMLLFLLWDKLHAMTEKLQGT